MTNGESSPCVVNITFKRIQEFLFAVPRLKAMTGANVLLGEVIRKDLVSLVKKGNYHSVGNGIDKNTFTISNGKGGKIYPDPLADEDSPLELYKQGVISRDGGHFTAVFKSKKSARKFIKKARKRVFKKLPGVKIEAKITCFAESTEETVTNAENWGESSIRLPYFQVCQDTGLDVANHFKENKSPEYTSKKTTKLEKAGDRFNKGKTFDILGLLKSSGKLPGTIEQMPEDLEQLAGDSGYIAVIHADGNGIGIRRKTYAGESDNIDKEPTFENFIEKEVRNEQFFYGMRTAVRACVVNALKEVFDEETLKKHKKLPYHLLMLGGDDLLLITQPQYAFPFIIEYSRQLSACCNVPYRDSQKRPISIGAGIAIAHHNVPFYHLHMLAESLADSAKKLYRSQQAEKNDVPKENSVVDWMVATTSWVNDIEQHRRLYELNPEGNCSTTAKPCFVLKENTVKEQCFNLEELWLAAQSIHNRFVSEEADKTSDQEKLPRSQLKNLLQDISRFEIENSKERYKEHIKPKPEELIDLFADDGENLWLKIESTAEDKHITQYKDLVELIELYYLGQSTKKGEDTKQGESHD